VIRCRALVMEDRAVGCLEVSVPQHTLELLSLLTAGTAIGADVTPAGPAKIGVVPIRTKLMLGIDGTPASMRGGHQGRWGPQTL
jgi:hypothetical protein